MWDLRTIIRLNRERVENVKKSRETKRREENVTRNPTKRDSGDTEQ